MENDMTSQWQPEIDDAGQPTETSRGFPARIAAAIATLAALTFADATPPQMALGSEPAAQPRAERTMPSACGAEAVARAQREVLGIRPPSPAALA
jgi:hypothetical protein